MSQSDHVFRNILSLTEINLSHSPFTGKTINLDTEILCQYNFGKFKNVFVATKSLESHYTNEFKF